MRRPHTRIGQGQILVIFAGGLVALLLIAALVVDVGFILMLRRHEQNAADPGAVAAARYIPSGTNSQMWTAACFYAVQNGFKPTRADGGGLCDPGNPTDGSTIDVNHPPSPAAGEFAGNPSMVEVVIASPHQSFFAGVIGLGSIPVSSSAVAAFDDGTGGAASLVALSSKGCQGEPAGKVNSGGVRIFPATGVTDPGGYIQVNSTCGSGAAGDDLCLGSTAAFILNGSGRVEAPALLVQGGCGKAGASGTIDIDSIDEGTPYVGDPLSQMRPPSPGDFTTQACPGKTLAQSGSPTNPKVCDINGTVIMTPGTYYGGWKIGNGTHITLSPGIYIVAGGGVSQTGGDLVSAAGRVMIYSTDAPVFRATCKAGGGSNAQCQGDIDITGSGSLDLEGLAFNVGCPPYGATTCPYGGMLVWQDATGSGAFNGKADIDIGGGTLLNVSGTVYSAGGAVSILGNGEANGCTSATNCATIQIIADTFQVGGDATLEMPYDPNAFFRVNMKGLVR